MLRSNSPRLRLNPVWLAYLLVPVLLLALPYWIFEGRLFIGGDDSRLFYTYPWAFLREFSWSSWFHFSSAGTENPSLYLLPMVGLFAFLKLLIVSPVVLSYLAFSTPFILGWLFFGRLAREVIDRSDRYRWEILLGSLLYIFSPIMIVNQWSVFLYAVWLVALLPLSLYYFIRFCRTGTWRYVVIHAGWLTLFSLAIFSVPWLLGFVLPLLLGLVVGLVRAGRGTTVRLMKRAGTFYGFALALQAFWIVPLLSSLFSQEEASFTGQALSPETGGTFADTVNATSRGSVIYPLLGLFHRQIAFDFTWELRDVYVGFYDKTRFLNLVLLGVIMAGLVFRRRLPRRARRLLLSATIALVAALLLFTVNVGPFKEIFLWLGAIPGFAMFRNAYDKFALGYAFFYAAVFTLSLVVVSRVLSRRLRIALLGAVGLVIALNALPMKQLVDKPLWMTDTGTSVTLPVEYTDFMKEVERRVPATTNVLSVPLGVTTYSIIKEEESDRVYAGRSPIGLLSGRNDFSGTGSFSPQLKPVVEDLIRSGDYQSLRNLLLNHNIDYVLETKNIPEAVRKSYLFNPEELEHQQEAFREALFGSPVASSRNGNYALYKLKEATGQNLVTTPSVLYGPPETFSQVNDATELFAFANPRAVLLNGTPHRESVTTLIPVEPNRPLTLARGRYRLFHPLAKNYLLRYDEQTGEISMELQPIYEINGESSEPERQLITTLDDPDSVVAVGNQLYETDQLDGVEIGADDMIRIYRPQDENVLGSTGDFFQGATRVDCNAYDQRPATDYDFTSASEVLALTARANHNACLYRDLPALSETVYRLSFEYRPEADSLDVQVYGDKDQLLSETLPTAETDWQEARHVFTTKNHRTVRPYFYSGKSAGQATTSYRGLALQPLQLAETIDVDRQIRRTGADEVAITADPRSTFTLSQPVQTASERIQEMRRWKRSDCHAVDAHPKVSFAEMPGTNGMELTAQDGHDACIRQDIPVTARNRYTVQFDYYTEGDQDVRLYVGYRGEARPTEVKLPTRPGEWQSFSRDLTVPGGAELMQLYLYSGKNPTGTALARYRNFQLASVSDRTKFLVKDAEKPLKPPRGVEVKKLNQTTYRVTFREVPGDFLAHFTESYHPGWKAYPASADQWYESLFQRPLALPHQRANHHSNAWWIEVEKTCRNSDTCQRNSNGTYDMTLVLHFTPQRYVYLGILLSLVAAGSGALYWRRRRPRSPR